MDQKSRDALSALYIKLAERESNRDKRADKRRTDTLARLGVTVLRTETRPKMRSKSSARIVIVKTNDGPKPIRVTPKPAARGWNGSSWERA